MLPAETLSTITSLLAHLLPLPMAPPPLETHLPQFPPLPNLRLPPLLPPLPPPHPNPPPPLLPPLPRTRNAPHAVRPRPPPPLRRPPSLHRRRPLPPRRKRKSPSLLRTSSLGFRSEGWNSNGRRWTRWFRSCPTEGTISPLRSWRGTGIWGVLVSLLDLNVSDSVREAAVEAVPLLVSAGDFPRKRVFEEGGLGPFLRIVECGSVPMKERAAMAVEFITDDPDNTWAVSAYGGVPILIELCKSGSVVAIRNVSAVEDIRVALAEEGAVPVLMQLLVSGSPSAQGKTANCISILASASEYFRSLLIQENGLQRLLHLFHECSTPDTLEHTLRAIYSLSASDTSYRMLSGSTAFIVQISELVKHGNVMLQHISASLLANLAISDGNKRAIAGCMGALVKLMERVKPDGMQEVGAKALISLLSVKLNRKELVRDEKSLMRLVQVLDPKSEVVTKKFPVAVAVAIMAGGSQSCRKKLVAAGAYGHVQRLAEMEVVGARKALRRLSVSRLTSILTRSWRE